MSKKRLFFAAIVCLCCSYLGSCTQDDMEEGSSYVKGDAVDVTLPVPMSGHPRLFITSDDISDLKRRWASSDPMMVALKAQVKEQATATSSGASTSGYPNSIFYLACEANALLYLVEDDLAAGTKAKEFILAYLSSIGPDMVVGVDEFDIFTGRNANRSILGAAIVYDWCYDLFTERELKELIADVNRVGAFSDYTNFGGWPLYPENFNIYDYIVDRWTEEKHPYNMAFGIASYDEDPEMYNLLADHLYNYFVEARNFSYESERAFYGSAYSGERMVADYMTTQMMTTMGYPRPYDERQGDILTSLIYMRRPDGRIMVEGDDWLINLDYSENTFTNMIALLFAVNEYENPYQHDELIRWWDSYEDDRAAGLFMALYKDDAPVADISGLPLTQYYGSPQGNMIARTSWDTGSEAHTAMVKVDMKRYNYSAHTHFDAGHFSIYYKGPLAIDAGSYTSYGNDHFSNYLTTTYAHNSLLIYDAADTEGDQTYTYSRYENIADIKEVRRQAELLEWGYGPDQNKPEYSYMKGDMAMAYEDRAKVAKRSFVTLNFLDDIYPGALVVYDKVITPEASTKKWLLHSEKEPVIDGNTISITSSTDRNADFKGLLVEQLLYPSLEDAAIEAVGGSGKEFWVEGINWPLDSDQDIIDFEAGSWRIEIANAEKSTDQMFLNVLHYKTAGDGNPNLNATAIESDELIGTVIKDRVVLFSKSGERLSGSLSFEIEGSGTYKTLITDLVAGNWVIDDQTVYVSEQEGCAYIELGTGVHTIQKK